MNYGQMIKDLRKSGNPLTQAEFAKKIGITQTYLSQIEKGHKNPSTELLHKISEYTKVPLPIMCWKCVTETDVHPSRKKLFTSLKPVIDELVNSFTVSLPNRD